MYGTHDVDYEKDERYARFCETFDAKQKLATFHKRIKTISPTVYLLPLRIQDLVRFSNGPARKDDMGCVLLGCSLPVMLRPRAPGSTEYYFISHATPRESCMGNL